MGRLQRGAEMEIGGDDTSRDVGRALGARGMAQAKMQKDPGTVS